MNIIKVKSVFVLWVLSMLLAFACKKSDNQTAIRKESQAIESKQPGVSFDSLAQAIFTVQTFDGTRKLERGKCFAVSNDMLIAPFSLFVNANRAEITTLNDTRTIEITEFWVSDRINDIIILKTDLSHYPKLRLYGNAKIDGIKTILLGKKHNNTLPLYAGKCLQEQVVQGSKLLYISNSVEPSNVGAPVFVSTGSVLGMATYREILHERTNFAIPAQQILELIRKKTDQPKLLSKANDANSARNAKIKRIVLETEYGDIHIRLYNETPAYRDNFVKLAEEGYYDGLLFHRIIRDFGIQTGAADSRNAKSDDPVGYRGPGYTIPAHHVPTLFHKRGAIGVPRKPDDKNNERRSDGSQFYIVTGRKYLDEELEDFEKQNKIKFTPQQRDIYKSVGGSPHLDGSYTVFGEVISGIEVADKMINVATGDDYRPMKDIRLKRVRIEY